MNRTRRNGGRTADTRGIALIAVLVAVTMLLLLSLPFAVSMSRGADVAAHAIESVTVGQLAQGLRDDLLTQASMGHPTFDPTPTVDDRTEYPDAPSQSFAALKLDGRARYGGEIWDLQRFLPLNAASPLLFANALGVTTRLRAELKHDSSNVQVDDATNLPDAGTVWIDHELIRYGKKEGNALLDVVRSVGVEQGFVRAIDHDTVAETALVLDYRCVLAASLPFDGRTGGTRKELRLLRDAHELAEVAEAGHGAFTADELDRFAAMFSGETQLLTAPTFGRPERLFDALTAGIGRTLRVKGALSLGPGSTVRIRNLRTNAFEFGLVMTTSTPKTARELVLPSDFRLELLMPVTQDFPAVDSVVEPLLPAPVNVNTADAAVLAAIFAHLRKGMDVRVHDSDGNKRSTPVAPFSVTEARDLAEQIVTLRNGGGTDGGPFAGWREIAERLFRPRFKDASKLEERSRLLDFYRALMTGRDSQAEMGTVPICFASGPLVGYRAAASLQRSAIAPGIAARTELSGTAIALPGLPLLQPWQTQEQLEEAFRQDQRAPYWTTTPVNLGASGGGEPGNDPSSRANAHVVGMAFPEFGLGQPRFPSRDRAEAMFGPASASIAPGGWGRERHGHESFWSSTDARGHDVARDGPFRCKNTGPEQSGPAPAAPRSHELSHPFTTTGGFAGRFATSFWTEPESLAAGTLWDYSDGNRERNRMALVVRDGELVFEVIDEAGFDPQAGNSPTGIPKAAAQWHLPLAEYGLPARTPMHVSVTAYGNRPTDVAVAVDGMVRGKVRYRSRLTSALPVYDPAIQVGGNVPIQQRTSDPRFVTIQVESTDGFPPVGALRVGLELFEYTEIRGNAFVCQYKNSLGGRGARMSPRELRPDTKVNARGEPVDEFGQAAQNGILDVFPEHPVGSEVELYGYTSVPSIDTPMIPDETKIDGALGAFTIARGYVENGRPIALQTQGRPIQLGTGLDINYNGDITLAEPPQGGAALQALPPAPPNAPQEILDGFPAGGGYALLVQYRFPFDPPLGAIGPSADTGGIEVVKYARRNGNKLTGITRAATLPGNDNMIRREVYDGTARQFVTDWDLIYQPPGAPRPQTFDEFPALCLWVVPITFPVQNASAVADPSASGLSEWLQLYPSNQPDDTEWVRYDQIVDRRLIARTNRAAWNAVFTRLTGQFTIDRVQAGPGGSTNLNARLATDPSAIWGNVTPSSGYIGYATRLESTYPEIRAARENLGFRGDPFTQTTSHAHPNSLVLPCHRLQLNWGNYGSQTGRPGRLDRVALVPGQSESATGVKRPSVEWHSVNWSVRRYGGDQQVQGQVLPELLGLDPFQLVAFMEKVAVPMLGGARNGRVLDTRMMDRIVKFPSGELPAAYCAQVHYGSAVGGGEVVRGVVDEIDVTDHLAADLLVDEAFTDNAQTLRVNRGGAVLPQGLWFSGGDRAAEYPVSGGLLLVDDEVIAYQSVQDGVFQIAKNGRGLIGTEPRGHDRGARVRFMTHRPAAILSGGVQPRDDKFPVQAQGAMPSRVGAALLGRTEILHYTWGRVAGEAIAFEMPRFWPPGEDGDSNGSHGLFRGRFGTTPVSATAGEPLISFPIRCWDRHVERSDDPEQAYFQLSTREAPVFFKALQWQQETQDSNVEVVCLVRADGHGSFRDDPKATPGLWQFGQMAGNDKPHVLGVQATQLEVRFATLYKRGCMDLASFRAHGWKTSAKIKDVRLEYEGEGRVLSERITAR